MPQLKHSIWLFLRGGSRNLALISWKLFRFWGVQKCSTARKRALFRVRQSPISWDRSNKTRYTFQAIHFRTGLILSFCWKWLKIGGKAAATSFGDWAERSACSGNVLRNPFASADTSIASFRPVSGQTGCEHRGGLRGLTSSLHVY